jgi:hypothetical protein
MRMMADEADINPKTDETGTQDSEWVEQVNSILAPKEPEPMKDS